QHTDLQRTVFRPLEHALLGKSKNKEKDYPVAARLIAAYADLYRYWIVEYYQGRRDDSPMSQEDLAKTLRMFVQHVGEVCSDALSVRIIQCRKLNFRTKRNKNHD